MGWHEPTTNEQLTQPTQRYKMTSIENRTGMCEGAVAENGYMGMQPTIGQCRSCGQPFQRRGGLLPTNDEYFRCPHCRGVTVTEAAAACCSVQ